MPGFESELTATFPNADGGFMTVPADEYIEPRVAPYDLLLSELGDEALGLSMAFDLSDVEDLPIRPHERTSPIHTHGAGHVPKTAK